MSNPRAATATAPRLGHVQFSSHVLDRQLTDLAREIAGWNKRAGSARHIRLELVGTSNGCRSFRADVGVRTVKCYECLTPGRARLVHRLSNVLRKHGVAMPQCLGARGSIVAAEWVNGSSMDSLEETEKIELLAAYQARIHGLTLPSVFRRRESMPHTRWLFDRVRRFGRGIVDGALVTRLLDWVRKSRPNDAPWGVLHPDLITSNLVVTSNGLVSVDNEFLCVGYGREWDILNSMRVSFGDRKHLHDRYLAAYAKYRSLHTLLSHRDYWETIYDIKMAGKRLSEGRIEEGLRHLNLAAKRAWSSHE